MLVQGQKLDPVVRLTLRKGEGDERFSFNPSVAELCRGVRSRGSLSAAAYDAQMSYSKAWNLIKGAERSLGVKLLISQGQGGSLLTPECEAILEAYDKALGDLQDQADLLVG
ncbi:MAG: LysR family transcriptional regulator [Coriobacteriia bacterium]|nr:LysR family transcriptional regulator [Coriobacteriia bacterium]